MVNWIDVYGVKGVKLFFPASSALNQRPTQSVVVFGLLSIDGNAQSQRVEREIGPSLRVSPVFFERWECADRKSIRLGNLQSRRITSPIVKRLFHFRLCTNKNLTCVFQNGGPRLGRGGIEKTHPPR